jgi:hypothetical protein
MAVIIDGHNLLWLIRNQEEDQSITDVGLCRLLDVYFGLTNESAEIIFDGIGPPDKSGFDGIRNLDITFSGRATDCDTLVENKILESTAPKRLIIVSSDRRLRDAADDRKATAIKSEDFWEMVKKRISKYKPGKEPAQKRKGLTQSETELWLKEFGIEKQ